MNPAPASLNRFFNRRRLGYPTALMSPGLGFAWPSSLTSLRWTPQSSAQETVLSRDRRMQICSAQEAAGVSLSEVKEETAQPAGDMSSGSRPPPLVRGTNAKPLATRRTTWAN